MTSNWETFRLGDVAETLLGKTLPRGAGQTEGGAPYLRNVNVQWGQIDLDQLNTMTFSNDERAKYELRRGDILVCEGGEIGRLAILERDMPGIYFQNALHRVRATNANINPWYLAMSLEYLVNSGGLEGISTRVTIAHLNQTKLRDLPVTLPPLAEQQRIVNLIGALDDAISASETSQACSETLLTEMISSLSSESSSRGKLTRLGEIMKLDLMKTAVQEGHEYPLVGILNRSRGLLFRVPVTTETTKYAQLNRVRPSQIIYSKLKAFEGSITVTPADLDERYASSEFPTFTCGEELHPDFFRFITSRPQFWEQMALNSKGMGGRRERLNPVDFLSMEVDLPSIERQRELSEVALSVELSLSMTQAHAESLRTLRSELLTSLLSGAHTIPESYDKVMTVSEGSSPVSVAV